MSGLVVKQGDTYTKWTGLLSNADGWIDVSAATQIKMVGKLQNGATLIGPVIATAVAKQAFTATTAAGSNVLTAVSAFTGISEGSTILGPGITPALAVVGTMNTTAGTLTMVDPSGNPVNATVTATAAALTANQGMTTYTPLTSDTANSGVFDCEFYIHFGTTILVVPNGTGNPTLTVNPALDLAGE